MVHVAPNCEQNARSSVTPALRVGVSVGFSKLRFLWAVQLIKSVACGDAKGVDEAQDGCFKLKSPPMKNELSQEFRRAYSPAPASIEFVGAFQIFNFWLFLLVIVIFNMSDDESIVL